MDGESEAIRIACFREKLAGAVRIESSGFNAARTEHPFGMAVPWRARAFHHALDERLSIDRFDMARRTRTLSADCDRAGLPALSVTKGDLSVRCRYERTHAVCGHHAITPTGPGASPLGKIGCRHVSIARTSAARRDATRVGSEVIHAEDDTVPR